MNCPTCNQPTTKFGTHKRQDGTRIQNYYCRTCNKRFSERSATAMYRLRTPEAQVALALQVRSEGLGLRAAARVLGHGHGTIARWEQKLAQQEAAWSPPAPTEAEVTIEGDEVYTRVQRNRPPL